MPSLADPEITVPVGDLRKNLRERYTVKCVFSAGWIEMSSNYLSYVPDTNFLYVGSVIGFVFVSLVAPKKMKHLQRSPIIFH